MRLQTTPADRKQMVNQISETLGVPSEYLRIPSYAYRIGCVTVNRDGTIDCDNNDELERLIPMLIENNYLAEAPADDVTPAAQIQEPTPIEQMDITVPVADMSVSLMRNIVFMLYSRQKLINKALGSNLLHIHDNVIARLQEFEPESAEEMRLLLDDFRALEELQGITFTADQLTMSFPFSDIPDTLTMYGQLVCKLVEACGNTGRTRAALQPLGDNEKYLMHTWLIRIGCGGPDFKALRKRMTEGLTGYCAFPDQGRADKHKAKYAEIRRIRRDLNEGGNADGN